MAEYLGDHELAQKCLRLFESGSKWMDEHLFNGRYYIQKIVPPTGTVPECLYGGNGTQDPAKPDYQLGEGCLIDQLVGQYMAHICGLGYLHRKENVKTAPRTIFEMNRHADLFDHFNTMRTFALCDEAVMLMAAYPEGTRPEAPFPYYSEVMIGFEYTAAAGMIFEGLEQEGAAMHPGHPQPVRRRQAQSVRRGGVRTPLCAGHDELGRGYRPDRISLQRRGAVTAPCSPAGPVFLEQRQCLGEFPAGRDPEWPQIGN